MSYIGKTPTPAPLTSSDITDGIISTDKLAANAVVTSKITDATISNADVNATLVTGQTAETSIADGDTILIHDASASALRKMTKANFVSGIGGANTPRFKVYNSADQSISTATNTQINFNSEFFDSNGAFANNTFTVPSGQAGFYLITMRYIMSGSFNSRMILYLRNNSTDIMGIQNHHETTDGGIILTTVVELAAGGTATARAYQDSGSTRTIVGGYQWNEFSGFKLI